MVDDTCPHSNLSGVSDPTPGNIGFVDSLPSLEPWTAATLAIKSNAEGEAIEKEFNEAAD